MPGSRRLPGYRGLVRSRKKKQITLTAFWGFRPLPIATADVKDNMTIQYSKNHNNNLPNKIQFLMTKFFLKFSGIALLLAVMIATGCQEDDPIVDPIGPDITLVSESGFVSSDVELFEGDAFSVKLSLEKGDNPLQTLSMTVDGVEPKGTELSGYVTSLTIDGTTQTAQNPQLITGTAKDGSTWEYELVPAGLAVDESATFAFRVTDESGLSASVSFKVTIVPPPGTPIEMTITGALLNQAGPAGTGGIDLDTGDGTGTRMSSTGDPAVDNSYLQAELEDEGINRDITPVGSANWRRQISSINGTVVRQADLTKLPETFSFDNVETKEQIKDVFDTGAALTGDDSTCNCTDSTFGEEVSEPVEEGDIFVVKKEDKYYLVRVDNIITVYIGPNEPGNNDDKYELSIKY